MLCTKSVASIVNFKEHRVFQEHIFWITEEITLTLISALKAVVTRLLQWKPD